MWHSYTGGSARDVLGPRPHHRSLMGLRNLMEEPFDEAFSDVPTAKKPRDDSKAKRKDYFKTFNNLKPATASKTSKNQKIDFFKSKKPRKPSSGSDEDAVTVLSEVKSSTKSAKSASPTKRKDSSSSEDDSIPDLDDEAPSESSINSKKRKESGPSINSDDCVPGVEDDVAILKEKLINVNRLLDEKVILNRLLEERAKSGNGQPKYETKIARLQSKVEELEKSNAEMSASFRELRKIRNLLVAKILVAANKDDENEEALMKLELSSLVKKYEDSAGPSNNDQQVEKLKAKVEKLKRFRDKWKGRAKAAEEKIESMKTETSTVSELMGLKSQLLSALNKDHELAKRLEEQEKQLKMAWLKEQADRDEAIKLDFAEALEEEKGKIERLHKKELHIFINREEVLKSVLNLAEDDNWDNIIDKIKTIMAESEVTESINITRQLEIANEFLQKQNN